MWSTNITQWIKAPLPWPLQNGLLLKHALLLAVFCCGVQQFTGQTWRIFVKGMSGQVGCQLAAAVLWRIMTLLLKWVPLAAETEMRQAGHALRCVHGQRSPPAHDIPKVEDLIETCHVFMRSSQ